MEKIGIGIVGLGMIATGVHLPGIQKCPDLELKAICDTDPEAVKAAQALYGIDDAHCFTDFKDLINCPEVDAVDICTPNYLHFPVAKYAISAVASSFRLSPRNQSGRLHTGAFSK